MPHGWSAWAGLPTEIPATSEHPSVLAALGKQLRRAVMQNVSSSPTQPSQMTCEAPSGLRGKSYATCISSPRSTAVSVGSVCWGVWAAWVPGGTWRGVLCETWARYVCSNTELFSAFITKAVGHESQKIM